MKVVEQKLNAIIDICINYGNTDQHKHKIAKLSFDLLKELNLAIYDEEETKSFLDSFEKKED